MDWQETYPVLGAKLASNSNFRPLANCNSEEENNNKSNTFMPEMHWIAQAETIMIPVSTHFNMEIGWENLIKDQSIFRFVIIALILVAFSLGDVLIHVVLGENRCWSLFELRGLRNCDAALVEEQNPNF